MQIIPTWISHFDAACDVGVTVGVSDDGNGVGEKDACIEGAAE